MQQAIIRLVVLVILLVNQTLILFGWNPLPYNEEKIYEVVSSVATVAVALWAWWKNNNVTEQARKAQEYLDNLKKKKGE